MDLLYEKDLRPFKFRILMSSRHEALLRALAARFGVSVPVIRKRMIERFDMQLLENLPARYEAAEQMSEGSDPVDKALGVELFTRVIPLLDPGVMDEIRHRVGVLIKDGSSVEDAVMAGHTLVKEALFR
ncbi:MAG: DUF1959 domain-containing protein [Methanomicrobiales archaeon]|nr:DUF1959 domain-containing protein [Methanomicrobiales archaeon]